MTYYLAYKTPNNTYFKAPGKDVKMIDVDTAMKVTQHENSVLIRHIRQSEVDLRKTFNKQLTKKTMRKYIEILKNKLNESQLNKFIEMFNNNDIFLNTENNVFESLSERVITLNDIFERIDYVVQELIDELIVTIPAVDTYDLANGYWTYLTHEEIQVM